MSGDVWGAYAVTLAPGATPTRKEVTFAVPRGQVAAVVGGDGAGKTTLLRTLVGGLLPRTGRVSAPRQDRCGFMPSGASGVWSDLTVEENIAFVAAAHHIGRADLARRRQRLLSAAGLDTAHDRLAGALSGGMRQKLAFCLSMLHQPDLLVLDEPSTGVDPVSRVDLWRLISQAAADGTAIAMATTYLDEAERASTCLVLDQGRSLAAGTPTDVLATTPGTITAGSGPAGDPELSWRRGRSTHSWHPGPPTAGEQPLAPDMEDCVIAYTLADQHADTTGSHR
ncbi:MAG: ABC transporter ATP-binding protein [Kitasatospora sp.]|nr:ABC transporter ATP-binding protein [Kitasatospora sp.]